MAEEPQLPELEVILEGGTGGGPAEMPTEGELPEVVPRLAEAEEAIASNPIGAGDSAAAAEAIRMLQEGTNAELTALAEQEPREDVASTVVYAKEALNSLYDQAVARIEGGSAADPLVDRFEPREGVAVPDPPGSRPLPDPPPPSSIGGTSSSPGGPAAEPGGATSPPPEGPPGSPGAQ